MGKETLAKMSTIKLAHVSSLLLLFLLVLGTKRGGQAWAVKFEGTEGPDRIIGTPEDDEIDSKGGEDKNTGDTSFGPGTGSDTIITSEGDDVNWGDSQHGDGSGNDVILSGEGDDNDYEDSQFGRKGPEMT